METISFPHPYAPEPTNSDYFSQSGKNQERLSDKAIMLFTDLLIGRLEQMSSANWKQPWFTSAFNGLPRNLGGRRYNGTNILFLTLHCMEKGWKTPIFATGYRWHMLNDSSSDTGSGKFLHILKGEKSFPVFLKIVNAVDKETRKVYSLSEYDAMLPEEKENCYLRSNTKAFPVFNIEQTNLQEVFPTLYEKLCPTTNGTISSEDIKEFSFSPFDEMFNHQGWCCPISLNKESAYFSPKEDKIVLPEKALFKDQEKFYGTAFHEMIHSTGLESRCNRDIKSSYGREELVAELGAAILAHMNGMKSYVEEDSKEYLKDWLDNMRRKPDFLRSVLPDVQEAVKYTSSYLDKYGSPQSQTEELTLQKTSRRSVSIR